MVLQCPYLVQGIISCSISTLLGVIILLGFIVRFSALTLQPHTIMNAHIFPHFSVKSAFTSSFAFSVNVEGTQLLLHSGLNTLCLTYKRSHSDTQLLSTHAVSHYRELKIVTRNNHNHPIFHEICECFILWMIPNMRYVMAYYLSVRMPFIYHCNPSSHPNLL